MAATEPRTTSAISVEGDIEVMESRAEQNARAYGAAAAKAFGTGSPTWQDVAPLIRAGWADRQEQAGDPRGFQGRPQQLAARIDRVRPG